MRLLIATKNAHKTAEIAAILGDGWQVEDLTSHPAIEAPEETGATFAENAAIKAVAASQLFPGLVLADDSGLEVDALGGAPGVISARYAGPGATDADNRARLLRELRAFPSPARFHCAMVVAREGAVLGTFSGAVEGGIIGAERGAGGFGYDILFVPDGFAQTFGELPAATKNGLSHRARALGQAREFLRKLVDAQSATRR
ncbi:MAG: non-canonical purine NTP pyrophosphatase [Chthoniobacteraceae bacterium]